MNLALEYHRSAPRYFAARAVSGTRAGGRLAGALAGNVAPLRLVEHADPVPPDESWARVEPSLSGICGSDLGLLTGRSSPYLGRGPAPCIKPRSPRHHGHPAPCRIRTPPHRH